MVIGECLPRRRHREFLRFLKRIDKETAADLDLHLILDDYATHKTAEVRRWLAADPRFHLHFTPTSASWLNLVERFFAEITEQRIRRGVFNSIADLEKAIMDYLEQHNTNPKPFVWTASAGAILEKVARAKQALEWVPWDGSAASWRNRRRASGFRPERGMGAMKFLLSSCSIVRAPWLSSALRGLLPLRPGSWRSATSLPPALVAGPRTGLGRPNRSSPKNKDSCKVMGSCTRAWISPAGRGRISPST